MCAVTEYIELTCVWESTQSYYITVLFTSICDNVQVLEVTMFKLADFLFYICHCT